MLKNRTELAKHFGVLGFTKGAEVGVFAGYYSQVLCDNIPNLLLLAVDNWHSSWRRSYADAQTRLKDLPVVIIEKSSVEAVVTVPDGSLDFVYIDAAHDYDNVKADIEAWTPKVRSGGIVSGDDYYHMRSGNNGVIEAVDEFVKNHGYDLQLTAWDDKNSVEDDRQPNWWFVCP